MAKIDCLFLPKLQLMVFLDYIFLIPLLVGLVFGFSKGFIHQIASLVGVGIATVGSFKFSSFAQNFFEGSSLVNPTWVPFVSVGVTFVLIIISIKLVANLLRGVLSATGLGIINKLLGSVFGVLKYGLLLCLFTHYFTKFNNIFQFITPEAIVESYFYPYFKAIGDQILEVV
ncbi:MAG: hypothetical protein C4K58_01980 [Flavobacteriaceae bacterium]|nr:MAG: hypothetical protein C4K58_01980 [Flavobacteriaceae bacterium]